MAIKKCIHDKTYPSGIIYLIDEENGTVECRIEKNYASQHLILSEKNFSYNAIDIAIMEVYKNLIKRSNTKCIVGIAKCNKELDTFDEKIGMQIAYNKAMLTLSKLSIQYYDLALKKVFNLAGEFETQKERKMRDIALYEGRIAKVKANKQ